MTDHVEHYLKHGYAVVRGVFGPDDIERLSRRFDGVKQRFQNIDSTPTHENVRSIINDDGDHGAVLRMVQWPAFIDPVLHDYRIEPRLLGLLEPLLGNDLKQITNVLFWKEPGTDCNHIGFHQDCRFRKPAGAFRDLGASYIQTGIAVDPHRPENGAMKVYPGSHLRGDLALDLDSSVSRTGMSDAVLRDRNLDPDRLVDLVLEPGDVALWGPYTVHGSAPNISRIDRRFYVNGYVVADNCDVGEWAFEDGRPVPLNQQEIAS